MRIITLDIPNLSSMLTETDRIPRNDDDLMMETDYSVMDSDDLDTDSDATEVPAKRVSLTTP